MGSILKVSQSKFIRSSINLIKKYSNTNAHHISRERTGTYVIYVFLQAGLNFCSWIIYRNSDITETGSDIIWLDSSERWLCVEYLHGLVEAMELPISFSGVKGAVVNLR